MAITVRTFNLHSTELILGFCIHPPLRFSYSPPPYLSPLTVTHFSLLHSPPLSLLLPPCVSPHYLRHYCLVIYSNHHWLLTTSIPVTTSHHPLHISSHSCSPFLASPRITTVSHVCILLHLTLTIPHSPPHCLSPLATIHCSSHYTLLLSYPWFSAL